MLKIRFPGFDVIYKYPELLFLFLFPSYHRNKRITQEMNSEEIAQHVENWIQENVE